MPEAHLVAAHQVRKGQQCDILNGKLSHVQRQIWAKLLEKAARSLEVILASSQLLTPHF